ncbi:MAG: hypothetical protein E1N59_2658 [Puniceicoccaceae bacterium 5H]|nr:MAG: hypothetical protein E1N59_2658 [Puniceicoccaceae bacterium 5H]
MKKRYQVLSLVIWNWVGLQIVTEINHYLSIWGLAVHLDMLWIVFAGVSLGKRVGLAYTFLFGILADAHLGGPHNLWLSIYVVAWGISCTARRVVQYDSPMQIRLFSVLLQALTLTFLAVALAGGQADTFAYWQRILIEGGISMSLMWLFSAPWFRLQHRLLLTLGWNPFDEKPGG